MPSPADAFMGSAINQIPGIAMSVRSVFIPLLLLTAVAWENAQAGELPLAGATPLPVGFSRPLDNLQLGQASLPPGTLPQPGAPAANRQYAVILWDETGRPAKHRAAVSAAPALPLNPVTAQRFTQALR